MANGPKVSSLASSVVPTPWCCLVMLLTECLPVTVDSLGFRQAPKKVPDRDAITPSELKEMRTWDLHMLSLQQLSRSGLRPIENPRNGQHTLRAMKGATQQAR